MEHEQELEQFWLRLRERLEAGARTYGEASFRRDAAELAGEVQEELLDVCGWAFVLWCRLRRLAPLLRLGVGDPGDPGVYVQGHHSR
ncbi:MAG: hypothetical protein ACP5VC_01445 [Bryobacteraceae bacterium]